MNNPIEFTEEEKARPYDSLVGATLAKGTATNLNNLIARIKSKARLSTLEALEKRLPEEKPEMIMGRKLTEGGGYPNPDPNRIGFNKAIRSVKQIIKEARDEEAH